MVAIGLIMLLSLKPFLGAAAGGVWRGCWSELLLSVLLFTDMFKGCELTGGKYGLV